METLIKKLGEIAYEGIYPCRECGNPDRIIPTGEDLLEECKQVAIEFVKHLLQAKVTKCTNGSIGTTRVEEEYWPTEYQLLLGELVRNSDKLFNKFIEEEYEK